MEIIDTLRENSLDASSPLELPTEEQIVEVEEQILIAIPFEFREYLLEASDIICGSLEPVTVADPQLHTYLPEVAAVAWSIGLPREFIPLCQYNDGYYCVSHDGIVEYWHDDEITGEHWDSLWQWAEDIWLNS